MKLLCFFIILFISIQTFAGLSPIHSYPPAVMHQLPSGERPGWEKPVWFNLDIQQSNFWNLPTRFTHNESGKELFYFNDFEQTMLVTEIGFELFSHSAITIELPVVFRSGGALDHFINEFHNVFGFINFNRNMYPEFQNQLNIRVDGVDSIPVQASGLGNIKIKYKNWFIKDSSCKTCGWALNFQIKIPLENGLRGLSSGYYDGSVLLHAGFMLSKGFNIYLSTGVTTTLNNKAFEQWPIYKLQHLTDISTEITFTKDWELVFAASLYSPYMNKGLLTYYDPESDPNIAAMNKVASGLNALTEWRAYEIFGVRHKQLTFYIQEDWGLGSLNGSRGGLYVNGAPDVSIGVKWENTF